MKLLVVLMGCFFFCSLAMAQVTSVSETSFFIEPEDDNIVPGEVVEVEYDTFWSDVSVMLLLLVVIFLVYFWMKKKEQKK